MSITRTTIKISGKAKAIVAVAVVEAELGVGVIAVILAPPDIIGHFNVVGTLKFGDCYHKQGAVLVV